MTREFISEPGYYTNKFHVKKGKRGREREGGREREREREKGIMDVAIYTIPHDAF